MLKGANPDNRLAPNTHGQDGPHPDEKIGGIRQEWLLWSWCCWGALGGGQSLGPSPEPQFIGPGSRCTVDGMIDDLDRKREGSPRLYVSAILDEYGMFFIRF